jgi:hypothetical protein
MILAAVLVSACGSMDFGIKKGSSESQSAGEQSQPRSQPQYTDKSLQEQHDSGRWVVGPRDGRLTIIGVSGRMVKADDEIETAKQDAARKASMYHGIQGSVEIVNTTGSGGFFDYSVDAKLDLNFDTNYGNYIERLSFNPETDVLRDSGAVFIRFQYNTSGLDVNYSPAGSDGRPSWVNYRNLPEFEGYATAVGHAGRRSRLRDTVNASYDSAAAILIESASTQVNARESSVTGVSSATALHMRSEGRLSNFQVLELWIDPGSQAVWTLAIARISK